MSRASSKIDTPAASASVANVCRRWYGPRGDVAGMSYGIETRRSDSLISRNNGRVHRTIANVQRLLDVTLTWEPAYPSTSVELRGSRFAALTLQELGVAAHAADLDDPDLDSYFARMRAVIDALEQGATIDHLP